MKNNVFLKSVLRQPIRSLILFALIAAAAFGFALRTTEFVIVRERINEIAEGFRSIGFLQVQGESYGNVLSGADIVAGSSYVDFEDRRRGFEAVMHGMQNSDIAGRVGDGGHVLFGAETAYRAIPERQQYAYFYGTVTRIEERNTRWTGHYIQLRLLVDDVVIAYPEHVIEGQYVTLNFHVDVWGYQICGIEIGERYFMRAALYWASTHGRGIRWAPPTTGAMLDILYLKPLTEDGLWYIHAPYGELDFTAEGMESIAEDIARNKYNHSVVWLRTTTDMSAMPMVEDNRLQLRRGRFPDRDDYLNARPVAMIHNTLAMRRGLNVGDTITISIPTNQEIVDLHMVLYFSWIAVGAAADREFGLVFGDGIMDFSIVGCTSDFFVEELELEIIGTFSKLPASPNYPTNATLFSNYIYIPDSLIPTGIMPVDAHRGQSEYLWDLWYSFVLQSSRYEHAFLLENRDVLNSLGMSVHFMPSEAANFWASAEPILLSVTTNAIMFWIVLTLILCLVIFLYLRQRRRDFAISRAIGVPARNAIRTLMTPLIFFGVPAIVVGAFTGWSFALNEAASTLNPLAAEMGNVAQIEPDAYMPASWLLLQIGGMTAIMLLLMTVAASRTAKLPVLELLQGHIGRARAHKAAIESAISSEVILSTSSNAAATTQSSFNLINISTLEVNGNTTGKAEVDPQAAKLRAKNMFRANLKFILRLIRRSPAKTAFTAIIAVFFIAAIALFQSAIRSTVAEVDRLYDTTIVSGTIAPRSPMAMIDASGMNNILLPDAANALMELDFLQNVYVEAAFPNFFIIPEDEHGNFPQGAEGDFWGEFWGYIRTEYWNAYQRRIDPLFAFNDLDLFLEEFGRTMGEGEHGVLDPRLVGFEEMGLGVVVDPIAISFGEGFSAECFTYDDYSLTTPVPVILADRTLERRGLNVGDTAFIAHYFPTPGMEVEPVIVPIIVIGEHNGSITRQHGRNAVLLPLRAMEQIRGDRMLYLTFNFEIDPLNNREISAFHDKVTAAANTGDQWLRMNLDVHLQDEHLRTVVGQMEQNLSLLLLLYPVVIMLSIAVAIGFALLLILQHARTAAILRVLGFPRNRTMAMLCTEHVLVVFCALKLALVVFPLLSISYLSQLSPPAVLYLVGATIGSVCGAILITKRAPLELLQVKE